MSNRSTDAFGNTMSKQDLDEALKARSKEYFYSVLGKDTILIVIEGDTLVGFIQFGEVSYDGIIYTTNDIELKKVFVNTAHHGKGIGKQLIEAMLFHGRLATVTNIYLDVYEKNKKAITLYEKYGFRVIDKVPYKANEKIIGYDLLMKRSTVD